MPIYEYAPDAGACAQCSGRFERLERLSDAPLTRCPACGQPCHRVPSAPSLGTGGAQRLKESHLGRHGFTQYRKVGKGQYEKTVGKGPDTLEA
ncbi:MAG: zinc ribbon domain-containing protein [Xanthomonadaceae bacterium]|jgi:putative FmdB family regulatory protein|nr:zinc ribbon domain-containing protein [Xanthomonadaceae bacterium]